MDTCEAFLNAYRELEEALEAKYGQRSGVVQSYAAGDGSRYYEELTLFRETRNLLSHHARIDGEHPVLPSESSLKKLLEIVDFVKNPPVALSVATPRESLFLAKMTDSIFYISDVMESRGYSHIPILEGDGSLKGVFSVGTLLTFAKDNKSRSFSDLKISDLEGYIPTEKHTTEKFAFCKRDAAAEDIKKLFTHKGPFKRRVAAVFVTSDGTPKGKLLGMITPWDFFKSEI